MTVTWLRNVQYVARVRGEGVVTVWSDGEWWWWEAQCFLVDRLPVSPTQGRSSSLPAAKLDGLAALREIARALCAAGHRLLTVPLPSPRRGGGTRGAGRRSRDR